MLSERGIGALTRRPGRIYGFGAEKKPADAAEAAKAGVKGAAVGAKAGPIGAVVGAVLGAGLKVFRGIGLAKKARAGRLAAQSRLVKYLEGSKTFAAETGQFAGTRIADKPFLDFYKMAVDINNNAATAAAQYRAEAGIA